MVELLPIVVVLSPLPIAAEPITISLVGDVSPNLVLQPIAIELVANVTSLPPELSMPADCPFAIF